jgi:hypothetical protein
VAVQNRTELQQRESRRQKVNSSSTEFVVQPVDELLVPAEFATVLKLAAGR